MYKKAFKAALPSSLPICLGFLFVAMSYGFLMRTKGFPAIYPIAMSALIYAGSMEFVTIELLLSSFSPLHAFLLTLAVNARHIFYGISMLEKYKGVGAKKFYLIFGMCDETFAINSGVTPPEDVDRGLFMFFVTLLNHIYWVSGAAIGALLGGLVNFEIKGIDFLMTALFVVMFVGKLEEKKNILPAVAGVICTLVCLLIFGADNFMIPSMITITAFLALAKNTKFMKKEADKNDDVGN